MADVNVTVMVDGRPAYSAGAVGTPDGVGFAIDALQHGLDHFRAVKGASTPQVPRTIGLPPPLQSAQAQQPQDSSL